MNDEQKLQLKKLTLTAWTNYLLTKGEISLDKQQKMISLIDKIKK